MGDQRRFKVMADFIANNFKPCCVADVAGGKGLLSAELAKRGFICTVIDPKAQSGKRTKFTHQMADDYDLVIGLHPDGAAEELCRVRGKPVVIVPCCNMWKGIERHGAPNLAATMRTYFKKNRVEWWETQLPMNGKNSVFVVGRGV